VADAPIPNFEMPSEMRQFAQKRLKEARKAFAGFCSRAESGDGHGATSYGCPGGHQGRWRLRLWKRIRQLQAEFLRTQMYVLSDQAKELGEGATATVTEATKPTT
jgi:hypothetical protein